MNAHRAQDMNLLERRTHEFSVKLFAELAQKPTFDVMREIAMPVAVFSVSNLLGVNPPEITAFADISDTIMRSMDAGLDPSTAEPGRLARVQLTRMVDSWMDSDASRGLLGEVRRNCGGWVDRDLAYVRNTARVMFQGGYSTTTAAIGNVVQTLINQPQALQDFNNGVPLDAGVSELIRFDGPVQGTSRIAMTACVVGGQAVKAGDTIVTLFAAANRDPQQFCAPGSLVLQRTPNPHLGYGWGTHSCLGTTAAQATLRGLVSALVQHPTSLHPTEPAVRRRTATMRVFASLPAAFAA